MPEPQTTQPSFLDSNVWVPLPPHAAAVRATSIHAFLVEDNPDIRDTIVETMEELAPVRFVGLATNEDSARLWLGANDGYWDIAIIDLMLAQGTGFGVLSECQQRPEMQKVVVLTSFVDEHFRQRCIELGADEVFDKAKDIEKLVDYCRVHAMYLAFMRDSGIAPPPADSEIFP